MAGNVKALKYALNHQLVYRDPAAQLDKVRKPVEPYKRVSNHLVYRDPAAQLDKVT